MRHRLWRVLAVVVLCLLTGLALALVQAPPVLPPAFSGVFWQPDCTTAQRLTDYRPLGASVLLIQWTALDNEDFSGRATSGCALDWVRVQRQSGQLPLVLGLFGDYNPTPARLPALAERSRQLLPQLGQLPLEPPAAGYYAPIELHPDWPAADVRAYLDALPRPLWVSAYAGKGGYDAAFVAWLQAAVPADVHLLIQDGVGVGHATPAQAASVVRALQVSRTAPVGVIMEVFRRVPGSAHYRSALPWELSAQFAAYHNLARYAFDGGHYMSQSWIRLFLGYFWLRRSMGLSRSAGPLSARPLSAGAFSVAYFPPFVCSAQRSYEPETVMSQRLL